MAVPPEEPAPSALHRVTTALPLELSSCPPDSGRVCLAELCAGAAPALGGRRAAVQGVCGPALRLCVGAQSGRARLLLLPEPTPPPTGASLEGPSLLLLWRAGRSPSPHCRALRHPALCRYLFCGQADGSVRDRCFPAGRQGAGGGGRRQVSLQPERITLWPVLIQCPPWVLLRPWTSDRSGHRLPGPGPMPHALQG